MRRDLLVCCGSLTLDNVVTAERRFLPRNPGGNVVYAALGARLWHGHVGLVSRVGSDYPELFLDDLAAKGLNLAGVKAVEVPHGMNVAFCYGADGSRVRQFPPEVTALVPEGERARFTDYTTLGPDHRFAVWTAFAPDGSEFPLAWEGRIAAVHCAAMPVERHLSIAARLRGSEARAAWIQVDSPWYDERDLTLDHAGDLLPLIDALLPSEDDAAKVAAGQGLTEAVTQLLEKGAKTVVLKRGGAGSETFRAGTDGRTRQPALPCRVVDLTGAGDAFCGGFLAGIHLTGDLAKAAAYGTVSASFAVEGAGIARLMTATCREAEDRLARLPSLTPTP